MNRLASLALLLLLAASSRAGPLRLTDGGADVSLPPDKPVLFVSHGAKGWDAQAVAKPGIDAAVAIFKSRGWPVIYLNSCSDNPRFSTHYMDDPYPTADICSFGGEHDIHVPTRNIVVTGGYADQCSLETVFRAVKSAASSQGNAAGPLVVLHYLMDATYGRAGRDQSYLPLLIDGGRRSFIKYELVKLTRAFNAPVKITVYVENNYEGTPLDGHAQPAGELIVRFTTSKALEDSLEKTPAAPNPRNVSENRALRDWTRALSPRIFGRW